MKSYEYQIIRYLHDHFTGEYVNVGVIVYGREERFFACKTTQKYQRITSMFPQANGRWIIRLLNSYRNSIQLAARELPATPAPEEGIEWLTRRVFTPDHNAIRLSEARTAIDIDLDSALNDLFDTQVGK